MPRSLPTELLALIASFTPYSALTSFSLTSTKAYAVSARFLYTSVAPTSVARTIQCLRTLASNAQVAQLVRVCTIRIPLEELRDHAISSNLVARALGNMANLTELSLQLGASCNSSVFKHATFKLRKLVCVVESDPDHPVSRFLESQPAIESLYLVCCPEGLVSLSPTALPALRDVAAPLSLLQYLLPTRLKHITRISLLDLISTGNEIQELATILRHAPTKPICSASVELVLGLDLRPPVSSMNLGMNLSVLDFPVPWIGLLRLEVHHGRVEREMLSRLVTAPFDFPALHTFVIVSQPEPEPQKPADTQLKPTPDALHDDIILKSYLGVLHLLRPSLERVVFPIGMYEYVKDIVREKEKEDEHSAVCTQMDCPTFWEAAFMCKSGWTPVPESTLSLQTLY